MFTGGFNLVWEHPFSTYLKHIRTFFPLSKIPLEASPVSKSVFRSYSISWEVSSLWVFCVLLALVHTSLNCSFSTAPIYPFFSLSIFLVQVQLNPYYRLALLTVKRHKQSFSSAESCTQNKFSRTVILGDLCLTPI